MRICSRSKHLPPSLRAFLDSSLHSPRRIWLYNLHSNKTCLTVWVPCLQMHLPSLIPGTFLSNKNSRRPIFPVRICITRALNSFVRLRCSLTMPFLGEGSSLCNARPRVSVLHFCFHSSQERSNSLVIFDNNSSFTYFALAAVDSVSSSLVFPRLNYLNLHPVASLADLSAASLPSIPIWAGAQCNLIEYPRNIKISILCTI